MKSTLLCFSMFRCSYISKLDTGESRIYPRALYRRFDPYVFTFDLETETVSTLIIFSVLNVSRDLYLSALRGRDDVFMSDCISSMIPSNANFPV